MRSQRRQHGAQMPQVEVGAVDALGDRSDLASALPRVLGADELAQAPLEAQPIAFELERAGVAGREGVLEGVERGRGGAVQEPPDRVEQRCHHRQPDSIIEGVRRHDMGRAAHLLARRVPLLAAVLVLAATLTTTASARADAPLPTRLARALAVPHLDTRRSAAFAVDLRSGSVVFARNETRSLQPASNEKLAVSYAALHLLGPAYRFHTEVLGLGRLDGTTWRGDLVLKGYGDPTLDDGDLAGLARRLRADWGIRAVTGAVLGDESAYDSVRVGPGWKSSYYIEECPPLSALVAGRAVFRGHVSTNPGLAAASLFRRSLERAGIHVAKRSGRVVAPATAIPLGEDVSVPLARIAREMDRDSDNFVAEMLLKQLGLAAGEGGSTAAGAAVVTSALADAGVPLAGVRVADGSGLSGLDRTTAAALVAELRAGDADPEVHDVFLGSLAVAGIAGTLEHRMQRLPARGRVIAKTGTTNAASALSGFVRDRYAFAVVMNGSPVASFWARVAQDRFATVLAGA